MRFSSRAREAEGFERALRKGTPDSAYANELRLASLLSAHDVRPDPAFSADLRASLMGAARAAAAIPTEHARPRRKRRWTIAAPAAAVALATGGVAFAVAGLQPSTHTSPAASPSAVDSALSTAQAEITSVRDHLASGRPNAAVLTTLRAQALRLQDMLITAYASGKNPDAIRALHQFALAAISELADAHAQVPAGLTSLYVSTLQTLVDIATSAESTCSTCGLPHVEVPLSVGPLLAVPIATSPTKSASTSSSPEPTSSPTTSTPVTPPASVSTSPTAPSTPQPTVPTIPQPTPTATLPTSPLTLPSALPTLPF